MKIVLTVFAPLLTAIAIRIILFLIAIIPALLGWIFEENSLMNLATGIGGFDPFVWNESWGYWILVVIGTFMAEMVIWQDD